MIPRILFVDHAGVLGGAELSLLDLARQLRDRSAVLLFADGPFRQRLEAEGVTVELLASDAKLLAVRRDAAPSPVQMLRPLWGLARQVSRIGRRYDVLYANSQKAFVVAAFAGVLARRPVIWHLRDVLCPSQFSRINIGIVVLLANTLCAKVVANSEATARAFVQAGGRATKVRVVHNGLDPAPFRGVADSEVRQVRASLGVSPGPLLGVFGRLSPWKGQHVAIEALTRLPGVQALIVGEALFGEEAYSDDLRYRARALRLSDRVRFLGWRSDTAVLMRAVDIVVHTSVAAEPFGRVLVEGMLAAKPVVATDAGGAREIVEHGATGLLIPPGDAALLAAAISSLLADASRCLALGLAGRERAERLFSLDGMVRRVLEQVEEVCRA
jgi:glycosyltransferase involved in cell wall biosynthesis